jgi:hypothetical protein
LFGEIGTRTCPPIDGRLTSGGPQCRDAQHPLPLQASVVHWPVQPGQTVAAGDVLAILDAMKMEHAVRAPAAGRVTHLCFAVGELVQEKDVLLNWELLAHISRGLEANLASKPALRATPVHVAALTGVRTARENIRKPLGEGLFLQARCLLICSTRVQCGGCRCRR